MFNNALRTTCEQLEKRLQTDAILPWCAAPDDIAMAMVGNIKHELVQNIQMCISLPSDVALTTNIKNTHTKSWVEQIMKKT